MNSTFWLQTSLRFLFRSRRTTLALGLMIACAVAVLVFISSVAVGINDSMILNSTGLYSGQITGRQLPERVPPDSLFVDGVSHVLQRFYLPGSLDFHGNRQSISLIAVDPDAELNATFLWKKIIKGSYIKDRTSEILISRHTAEKLGVSTGDTVSFRSGNTLVSLIVTGIFHTGIGRFDNVAAFCPMSLLPDRPEKWDAAVFLAPGRDPDAIMAVYNEKGVNTLFLKTWKTLMPDLTQLIELNRISMGFVMVLVLGVVSFGTACAFAIFIISSIREYGILKAMGVTPRETVQLIFFEVILLNLMASLAGTLAGLPAVLICSKTGIDLSSFTSHNQYFVVSGVISPRLTPFLLFLPSVLLLCFCLLAAVWPTLIVIRQRSSDILRSI